MTDYLAHIKELLDSFEKFTIVQIPRLEHSHANALPNLVSTILVIASQSIPLVYPQWTII